MSQSNGVNEATEDQSWVNAWPLFSFMGRVKDIIKPAQDKSKQRHNNNIKQRLQHRHNGAAKITTVPYPGPSQTKSKTIE